MKRTVQGDEYGAREKQLKKAIDAFLASPQLARSKTTHSLASYLLEEEISGRGEVLTPYAVGVDALRIGEDFDPSTDSRVRVEMKRLRDALSDYNSAFVGTTDVMIDIPPRQYRPRFLVEDRDSPKPAVARLGWASGSILCALALTLGLVFLFGYEGTARSKDAKGEQGTDRTAAMLELHLQDLTGTVRSNDTMIRLATALTGMSRVGIRILGEEEQDIVGGPESYLVTIRETEGKSDGHAITVFSVRHVDTGEFVTSVSIHLDGDLHDSQKRSQQISKVASSLASHRGVIHSDYYRHGDVSPTMACLAKTDTYMSDNTTEAHLAARDCAEKLIAGGVRVAELYLSLASLFREEATDQRNVRPGNPIARALAAAQEAMSIKPDLAEAYYIAATIHGLSGNPQAMKRLGFQAIEMSPYEARFLAGIGYMLTVAGEFEEGLEMQRAAEELEPNAPAWREYGIFLASIALDDEAEWVSRGLGMGNSSNPLYLAAYAMAAQASGRPIEALDALQRAEALAFVKAGELGSAYERRSYHPVLMSKLTMRLKEISTQDGAAQISQEATQ